MHLKNFDTDVDIDILIEIATQYCNNEFSRRTIEKLDYEKLVKFIIEKKYEDFLTFLKGFMQFTKYDPKLNTLLNNDKIFLEQNDMGVKFFFKSDNDYRPGVEVREINYLYAILENYMYGSPSSISNDYLINTNYNEFHLEFYPNWFSNN